MSAQAGYTVEAVLALTGPSALRGVEHFADFQRTRIRPGADPRVPWVRPYRFGDLSVGPVYEYYAAPGKPAAIIGTPRELGAWGWNQQNSRYVPIDVCRWRDPEHRAELTRRARELAAAVRRAGGE